jgi:uroporphyrin-3 C-methyltransferase
VPCRATSSPPPHWHRDHRRDARHGIRWHDVPTSPDPITVTDTPPPAPRAPRLPGALWLLLLLLLVLAGWRGWHWWQTRQAQAQTIAADTDQQLQALAARLDALRGDQRAQAQRLQQADATNRVLRDELLGLGQRAALLEDSVNKLADPERHGAQALRLDEVELLLSQGEQRLQLSGDLDGARRAYALAAGVLDGVDDPASLNLRQALVQERAALDALGSDPKALAAGRLDAFVAGLRAPSPAFAGGDDATRPWWRRAFARILEVQPSDRAIAVAPGDRAAGYAALQLELALARAAVERRDSAAWRAALTRADQWLQRLWADSPGLRRQRAQLQALRELPLAINLPTLGSTLQQLRQTRTAR